MKILGHGVHYGQVLSEALHGSWSKISLPMATILRDAASLDVSCCSFIYSVIVESIPGLRYSCGVQAL